MATPSDVVDSSMLHPHYQPRSPIRTRGMSAKASQQAAGAHGSSSGKVPAIPISNPFGVLEDHDSDDDDDDDDDDDEQQQGKSLGSATSEEKKEKCQNKRQPKIVCLDSAGAEIDNLLFRAKCEYMVKIMKKSVQVFTLNRPMFEKVKSTLKKGNINFYSYDSPEQAPVKIVLTGFIPETIEGVKETLAAHDVKPRDIKLLSKTETITGVHVLYLLYFDRGSVKIQDLRRIKSLDGFVVSWRFFIKRPTDAAQCHRCQRFGHGSRNCNLPVKCVKCGEAHLTEACTLPRKETLQMDNNAELTKPRVKCANCQGNHTANFRGCSARKVYIETLEKQKQKSTAQPSPRSNLAGSRPPGWRRTYASVTATTGDDSPTPEHNNFAEGDLFTLTEFLALAREMFTRFRACRSKEQQFLALGELMMKYVGYGTP